MKDPANPYQGGGKAYWQYGGEMALKRWAELDGCKGSVKSRELNKVTFNSYDVCKSGSRIHSYVIDNWDHAWPRSAMKAEAITASSEVKRKPVTEVSLKSGGEVTRQVDAADRMWEFFQNKEGQMVVDAVAKSDCTVTAVSASASAKASETACTQSSKSISKSVSKEPVVEDAL
jgi:polyhydroxybutyrate depolymerase